VAPIFIEKSGALASRLQTVLHDDDILVLQGAGDIGAVAARLAATALHEVA
jgi:UDP-N-acetylmuramate--alanine ligase